MLGDFRIWASGNLICLELHGGDHQVTRTFDPKELAKFETALVAAKSELRLPADALDIPDKVSPPVQMGDDQNWERNIPDV